MFFTYLARIVAILALVGGVMQLALGLSIASGLVGPYEVALARYTTADSSGEVINKAMFALAFAVVLGTLAEIGFSLKKLRDTAATDDS